MGNIVRKDMGTLPIQQRAGCGTQCSGVANQAGHDAPQTQKENMIPFLKLTPEACQRMWYRARYAAMIKFGKTIHYQMNKKWMRLCCHREEA